MSAYAAIKLPTVTSSILVLKYFIAYRDDNQPNDKLTRPTKAAPVERRLGVTIAEEPHHFLRFRIECYVNVAVASIGDVYLRTPAITIVAVQVT